MNEKVSNFFKSIGVFFVGLFFGIFLHRRKRTNTIRKEQSEAERTYRESGETIANVESGIGQLENTTAELERITRTNDDILRTIRERKKDN